MKKSPPLNFEQIISQAARQPAQFAQLAPERAGLQGEHYFHELDALGPTRYVADLSRSTEVFYRSFCSFTPRQLFVIKAILFQQLGPLRHTQAMTTIN